MSYRSRNYHHIVDFLLGEMDPKSNIDLYVTVERSRNEITPKNLHRDTWNTLINLALDYGYFDLPHDDYHDHKKGVGND